MKAKLLIAFFVLYATAFSQSYKTIKKAERKINGKEYAKALRLLNRALKEDYGFCGNAKIEAEIEVNALKLRLYRESGDYVELIKFLDGIEPFLEFETIYSAERIRLALRKYSKTNLNAHVVSALSKFTSNEYVDYSNIALLQIDTDYTLKLLIRSEEILELQEKHQLSFNDALVRFYNESEYFKILND